MYDLNNCFNIEFKILKKIFNKDRFYINKVRILNNNSDINKNLPKEIILKGEFACVFNGDIFISNVKVVVDKYSYSLQTVEIPKIKETQLEINLINFLKKIIPRMGKKRAKEIVSDLGFDCIDKIINDYTLLTNYKISLTRAELIKDILFKNKMFEELISFMQTLGIDSSISFIIYEKFKETSIVKIRENPYILINFKNIDFHTCDLISYKLKKNPLALNRTLALIKAFINNKILGGDLRIFKDDLYKNLNEFSLKTGVYINNCFITKNMILHGLNILIENKELVELKDTDDYGEENVFIYTKRCFEIENSIISNLKRLITANKNPFCLESQIDNFISEYEINYFKLALKQKEALKVCIKNPISILTGKPGTGKTQTTNTIVSCIKKIKPLSKIVLFAPTGKASRRMTELTNMKATTIHKGLNINEFHSYTQSDNFIIADFLIIDESSMIDASIFSQLLNKIDEKTRLILVGDYNQLPSVGAGLILRDLIFSNKIPTIELDEIFRQAKNSQITMNSHAIINGNFSNLTYEKEKDDFFFINKDKPEQIRDCIVECIDRLIKNKGYSMKDIIVLAPMKDGVCGVKELNRVIQIKFNPTNIYSEYIRETDGTIFRVGDKIINNINNYDLNIMNGETGIISKIYSNEGEIAIDIEFSDKDDITTVSYVEMDNIDLAYAITIHKSQGSEFSVVIIPIHNSQKNMLTRNLIYTAVTRGRQKVVLIGQKNTLNECIKKQNTIKRLSGIKNKIVNTINL